MLIESRNIDMVVIQTSQKVRERGGEETVVREMPRVKYMYKLRSHIDAEQPPSRDMVIIE